MRNVIVRSNATVAIGGGVFVIYANLGFPQPTVLIDSTGDRRNANPNLTRDEDLAESARAVGLNYPALLTRIVNLGLSYMPEWRMFEG